MLKRFIGICFTISAMTFFTTNAAQLNLTLGDDLKSHQNNLNIEYSYYYASGPGPYDRTGESQKLHGLMYQHIFDWLTRFNQKINGKHFIDNYDGKHSQITLGYQKDGVNVYPTSCQNIGFKDLINITLTESGCSVS